MRWWFYAVIIFTGGIFLLGCSDNMVYNDNVQYSEIKINRTDSVFVNSRRGGGIIDIPKAEEEIFAGVNNIRKKHGAKPLSRSAELDAVARNYSRKMSSWGEISHREPSGKMMEDRLEAAGVTDWSQAGENLAYSSSGAEPVQSALWGWQNSPEHMENMLHPAYVYTGVGVYQDSKGDYYVTQLFLTPAK